MDISIKFNYTKKKYFEAQLSLNKKIKKPIIVKKKNQFTHHKMPFQKKAFSIGFGKTGTTSLEYALKKFGFTLGNQAVGELLLEDWHQKRYERIINFCYTAQAFQDLPFGCPGLYKVLDEAFPKSKFILTIRDDSEQWYNSLIRFHSKLWADGERIPTAEDLGDAVYRYKGFPLESAKMFWGYPKIPLYNKEAYIAKYEKHNKDVVNYFKDRPNDLLILNVAEQNSYQKLARFLNVQVEEDESFPWLNKTNA